MSLTFVPPGTLSAVYLDGPHGHPVHHPVVAVDEAGVPYVVAPGDRRLRAAGDVTLADGRFIFTRLQYDWPEPPPQPAPPGWYAVVESTVSVGSPALGSCQDQGVESMRTWHPVAAFTVTGKPLLVSADVLDHDGNPGGFTPVSAIGYGELIDVVYEPTRTVNGLDSLSFTLVPDDSDGEAAS